MDISEICEDAAAGRTGHDPESLLGITRALAQMDGAEVEALIQRALHPSVPVGVLFAALDRYTALSWVAGGDAGRPGEPYPPPAATGGHDAGGPAGGAPAHGVPADDAPAAGAGVAGGTAVTPVEPGVIGVAIGPLSEDGPPPAAPQPRAAPPPGPAAAPAGKAKPLAAPRTAATLDGTIF